MKKRIANALTYSRIVLSIIILFFPALSSPFYACYIFCGISNMIDGTIARKTNSTSEFGAKLDTFADTAFFLSSAIKLLPLLHFPKFIWIWFTSITVLKFINIAYSFIRYKKLISTHTVANKVTGLFLFPFPFIMSFDKITFILSLICSLATFSAIQEFYYIKQSQEIF